MSAPNEIYLPEARQVTLNNHVWPRGAEAIELGFMLAVGFISGISAVLFIAALVVTLFRWCAA